MMDHAHVLEAVNDKFVDGWNKARSAHLTLSINPLNGLSNIVEELVCEEYGWEQIDRDVLLPFVTDPPRFHELEEMRDNGTIDMVDSVKLSQLENRALGEYGKSISTEIRVRHGL